MSSNQVSRSDDANVLQNPGIVTKGIHDMHYCNADVGDGYCVRLVTTYDRRVGWRRTKVSANTHLGPHTSDTPDR